MLILGLESSAKAASAAVTKDGALLGQSFQCSGLTHSRTLLPMAEDLLNNLGLRLSDLDAVAVAQGPGSFTGVRIGVATVKGLCWGADKPAIGVSSLEAMAWNGLCAPAERLVCCAMDARRNQIYNALFACANGSVRVYTGLMDAMTDDELLGVIGHEMGHVALHHTRKQMQKQMLTSATLAGLASTSEKVAVLTDSQLGALGEVILNAKFSRDMETEADDYGYNYLCEASKNPWAMVQSFEKMEKLSGSAGQTGGIMNLFSSHPDTQKRIEHISQRCLNDGYKRP